MKSGEYKLRLSGLPKLNKNDRAYIFDLSEVRCLVSGFAG
jgi:hypothetical protein